MALPVVGPKQLHLARLSPQARRIIARRARGAARREYAPVLAADRAAYGVANREYGVQKQSVRGATSMVENALAQALRSLGSSGLKGGYLKQVQHELTARQADAADSIPALLAGAQEDHSKAIQEANMQLLQDRAQMQQSAASTLNQLLKEGRESATSYLKSHSGSGTIGKLHLDPQNVKNAEIALQTSLVSWAKNPKVEVNGKQVPIQQAYPLTSKGEWLEWAEQMVHHSDGFDLAEAIYAIHHYLQHRSHAMHKGKVPQLGVPYGPRQFG